MVRKNLCTLTRPVTTINLQTQHHKSEKGRDKNSHVVGLKHKQPGVELTNVTQRVKPFLFCFRQWIVFGLRKLLLIVITKL